MSRKVLKGEMKDKLRKMLDAEEARIRADERGRAFVEAANEARRREEFARRRASRHVLGGDAAGEHLEAARSLKCIAQWLEKKAAAIRAAKEEQ